MLHEASRVEPYFKVGFLVWSTLDIKPLNPKAWILEKE